MFIIIIIHLVIIWHSGTDSRRTIWYTRTHGNLEILCARKEQVFDIENTRLLGKSNHTHIHSRIQPHTYSHAHTPQPQPHTYKHTRTNIQPHSIMNLINENFQAKQFWNKFEYLTPKRCRREKKYYSSEFHLVASPIIGFCIPKIPWKLISFLKTTMIWRICLVQY